MLYICNLISRAINSVGSECLPYKEEVGGSSPSLPTKKKPTQMSGFLFYCKISFLLTTPLSVIISKK